MVIATDQQLRRQWQDEIQPRTTVAAADAGRAIARVHSTIHSATAIRTSRLFSVDRVVPCGSSGRGTDIPDSDIDLVVYVNPSSALLPPSDNLRLLQELSVAFQQQAGYQLQRAPRDRDHALFLRVDNTPVDVVLARNCKPEGTGTAEAQALGAMEMLLENVSRIDMYHYSTAFSETANSFVRSLPAWVNELVRIAKYRVFNSTAAVTMTTGETLLMSSKRDRATNGLTSYSVEVLAIWAAIKVAPHAARSTSSGSGSVIAALLYMYLSASRAASLQAVFETRDWPQVWQDLFARNGAFRALAQQTRAQRPCVEDPANPLNNLCAGPNGPRVTVAGWELLRRGMSAAAQWSDAHPSRSDAAALLPVDVAEAKLRELGVNFSS
ncbi:hypothetical protein JKP88DRAFT_303976 [Tribonema minus]|uniref:Polymerase nucleotidyl transferase domain-containing protein n=1 Tax=Tribonema minus TaxID=303371 RepID=A0A836CJ93_9STRA|nr:hypothetical protein JKP88DRAFT_303976 [Tribonema minus]